MCSDVGFQSSVKPTEVLEHFHDTPETGMPCIVNSPGAALIGDDVRAIAQRTLGDRPFLSVETPGFSLASISPGLEMLFVLYESSTCAITERMASADSFN